MEAGITIDFINEVFREQAYEGAVIAHQPVLGSLA